MNNKWINSKILTGWLLLLLFALPPAAKNIHICQCLCCHDIEHDGENNHARHDCDNCAICQFVVFPFTEPESTGFFRATGTIYSKQYIYREHINSCVTYNYMLRAPPATHRNSL
ncbi:MAG: hypothetical protein LBD76_07390 [Prevotellaceae bacterium]|jgi:hypothetical protein|nr:hypothetical protein [Prevotellaceae bacterium]